MKEREHSVCPAKWHYSSICLEYGKSRSCHLVPFHHIDDSFSSFHDTAVKQKQRDAMVRGEKPKACRYCWDLERCGKNSPRKDYLNQYPRHVYGAQERGDHQLKYLEVSFGSSCTLSCLYCNPQTSSSLYEEYRRHGRFFYEDFQKRLSKEKRESLLQHFWEWLPSVYKNLEDLRITGGEPFLSKEVEKLLRYLEAHPHKKLKLSFNSSLSVPTALLKRYTTKVNDLIAKGCIRSCTFFTSLESVDKRAEFIRHGLDFTLWQRNVDHILKETKSDIVVTHTKNYLSASTDAEFESFISGLTDGTISKKRIKVTYSDLVFPRYLSMDVINEQERKRFSLNEHNDHYRKINPFIRYYLRAKLKKFIKEIEKRRGGNFVEVFPEFASLYYERHYGLGFMITLFNVVALTGKKLLSLRDGELYRDFS